MEEDAVFFSDLTIRELKKYILAACGGSFNSAYFTLLNTPIGELLKELEVFNDYQTEKAEAERKYIEDRKSPSTRQSETIMEGNI